MDKIIEYWPQWAIPLLLLMSFAHSIDKQGKARKPYDPKDTFIACVIWTWLLWMGGFWS